MFSARIGYFFSKNVVFFLYEMGIFFHFFKNRVFIEKN